MESWKCPLLKGAFRSFWMTKTSKTNFHTLFFIIRMFSRRSREEKKTKRDRKKFKKNRRKNNRRRNRRERWEKKKKMPERRWNNFIYKSSYTNHQLNFTINTVVMTTSFISSLKTIRCSYNKKLILKVSHNLQNTQQEKPPSMMIEMINYLIKPQVWVKKRVLEVVKTLVLMVNSLRDTMRKWLICITATSMNSLITWLHNMGETNLQKALK